MPKRELFPSVPVDPHRNGGSPRSRLIGKSVQPDHRAISMGKSGLSTGSEDSLHNRTPMLKMTQNIRDDVNRLSDWVHSELVDAAHRESNLKERVVRQIRILDVAYEKLAEFIDLHCTQSSELAVRLWKSNKELFTTLYDDMSITIKQSNFILLEKSKFCHQLRLQWKAAETRKPADSIPNRAKFENLQQVSLFNSLMEDVDAHKRQLRELQSLITSISLWFPNFKSYGSSILCRYLPPVDYVDESFSQQYR